MSGTSCLGGMLVPTIRVFAFFVLEVIPAGAVPVYIATHISRGVLVDPLNQIVPCVTSRTFNN